MKNKKVQILEFDFYEFISEPIRGRGNSSYIMKALHFFRKPVTEIIYIFVDHYECYCSQFSSLGV
jgi:hypothetical protein